MAIQVTAAASKTAIDLNDIKAERDALQERIDAINKTLTATSPDTEFTEQQYVRYAVKESVNEAQEFVKQARLEIEYTESYLKRNFRQRPTDWQSSYEGTCFQAVIIQLEEIVYRLRSTFNDLDLSDF